VSPYGEPSVATVMRSIFISPLRSARPS
jgi:hypothetical protein